MVNELKIYDPKKGQEITVGRIEGACFRKKVKSKHYMRKYQGYGIDKRVIDKLLSMLEIDFIIIETKTTIMRSTIPAWINRGTRADFGHGEQYFLAVKEMTII